MLPPNLRLYILFLIPALFALAPSVSAQTAANDDYEFTESFMPQTKREKLAYMFHRYQGAGKTVIPCSVIPYLRYFHGFGDGAGANIPLGSATSQSYKEAQFQALHKQVFLPGKKFYLVPVSYSFVKYERYLAATGLSDNQSSKEQYLTARNAHFAKYPHGEFVGYFKFNVERFDELLDPEKTHKPLLDSGRYHATQDSGYGDTAHLVGDTIGGGSKRLPVIYRRKEFGRNARGRLITTNPIYNRVHIVTENCYEPSMHYLDENYSDIWTAAQKSIQDYSFFYEEGEMQLQPPNKNYGVYTLDQVKEDISPVELGFWLDYMSDELPLEKRLAQTELMLQIAKTPAYMVPGVGMGLSFVDALECDAQGNSYCWTAFALDAASDVLMIGKIPALSARLSKGVYTAVKAAPGLKRALVTTQNVATFIPGLQKLKPLSSPRRLVGLANLGLAAMYAYEGEVVDALARGFAGAGDIDIVLFTERGITVWPLRVKGRCAEIPETKNVERVVSKIEESSTTLRPMKVCLKGTEDCDIEESMRLPSLVEYFGNPVKQDEMIIKDWEWNIHGKVVRHPAVSVFREGSIIDNFPMPVKVKTVDDWIDSENIIYAVVRDPSTPLGFKLHIAREKPIGQHRTKDGNFIFDAWGHPTIVGPEDEVLYAGEMYYDTFLKVIVVTNKSGRVSANADKNVAGLEVVIELMRRIVKDPKVQGIKGFFGGVANTNGFSNALADRTSKKDEIRTIFDILSGRIRLK